ncbi:hypothetical protein COY95_03365, partial [Candidatus Woesearchaeota archaeon CG_4_10_14_0_8_um_filter_47_5]
VEAGLQALESVVDFPDAHHIVRALGIRTPDYEVIVVKAPPFITSHQKMRQAPRPFRIVQRGKHGFTEKAMKVFFEEYRDLRNQLAAAVEQYLNGSYTESFLGGREADVRLQREFDIYRTITAWQFVFDRLPFDGVARMNARFNTIINPERSTETGRFGNMKARLEQAYHAGDLDRYLPLGTHESASALINRMHELHIAIPAIFWRYTTLYEKWALSLQSHNNPYLGQYHLSSREEKELEGKMRQIETYVRKTYHEIMNASATLTL